MMVPKTSNIEENMAVHKSTSRKHSSPPKNKRTRPEPGFERPAPPAATNYQHAEPPGALVPVPGAGALPKEDTQRISKADRARRVKSPMGRSRAPNSTRSAAASEVRRDAPLSVPNDSVGPQPSAPDVPELYDPNYTAASSRHARAIHRNIGPDAHVRDAMASDPEYCEPDTNLPIVAEKMADRDVGAIPVVDNMNAMRPIGIITDRDIVVRVIAKGQDPYSLRTDQVMSIDPITIVADAPLREAILLMERRQIRRLIVVDRKGRLLGMLAQADIAEATTRLETGELLQQVSEPSPQESRGRYH